MIQSKLGVRRGGEFDRWDLETSSGIFAAVRGLLMIEEHGGGKQLIRMRSKILFSGLGIGMFLSSAILSLFAAFDNALFVAVILGVFSLFIGVKIISDAARAAGNLSYAFSAQDTFAAEAAENVSLELSSNLEESIAIVNTKEIITRRRLP